MIVACPNGHDSEWPDWCSVCGERLGAAAAGSPDAGSPSAATPAQPAPSAVGPTCDNCGVVRHEHDVFCESCGYDFASGSLPEVAASAGTDADAASPMHAKVTVDAAFFTASVGDTDLSLPDPLPPQQIVPLPGIRILIGRTSTSRGVFPELDIRALTNDPAVSTRHAMLERLSDGTWTLTDLGSTNGTYLDATAEDAIEAGSVLPFGAGSAIYIGAWTRVELAATTSERPAG